MRSYLVAFITVFSPIQLFSSASVYVTTDDQLTWLIFSELLLTIWERQRKNIKQVVKAVIRTDIGIYRQIFCIENNTGKILLKQLGNNKIPSSQSIRKRKLLTRMRTKCHLFYFQSFLSLFLSFCLYLYV